MILWQWWQNSRTHVGQLPSEMVGSMRLLSAGMMILVAAAVLMLYVLVALAWDALGPPPQAAFSYTPDSVDIGHICPDATAITFRYFGVSEGFFIELETIHIMVDSFGSPVGLLPAVPDLTNDNLARQRRTFTSTLTIDLDLRDARSGRPLPLPRPGRYYILHSVDYRYWADVDADPTTYAEGVAYVRGWFDLLAADDERCQ